MQSLADQLEKKVRPDFKIKVGAPRKVTHAYLHQTPMWPGKGIQDNSFTPQKYPHIKMLWIPGDGLLMQHEDGTTCTVGASNVIDVVHSEE